MYKLDKNCNSVFSLFYHFITVVKYRKKVFTREDIITDLKSIIEKVAEDFDWRLWNKNVEKTIFIFYLEQSLH